MVIEAVDSIEKTFESAKSKMWINNLHIAFIKFRGIEIKVHINSALDDIRDKYVLLKQLQESKI